MEIKSIKNVDEATWGKFKLIAAESKVKMAILLKLMVEEFEKNSKTAWNRILNGEKNLSDKEARDIDNVVEKSRKEHGFRE